jgi:hypothetical protein
VGRRRGRVTTEIPAVGGAAFTQAFSSIKPTDGIFVGMFPRVKDEVRENAERTCRVLRQA